MKNRTGAILGTVERERERESYTLLKKGIALFIYVEKKDSDKNL